MNNMKIIWL